MVSPALVVPPEPDDRWRLAGQMGVEDAVIHPIEIGDGRTRWSYDDLQQLSNWLDDVGLNFTVLEGSVPISDRIRLGRDGRDQDIAVFKPFPRGRGAGGPGGGVRAVAPGGEGRRVIILPAGNEHDGRGGTGRVEKPRQGGFQVSCLAFRGVGHPKARGGRRTGPRSERPDPDRIRPRTPRTPPVCGARVAAEVEKGLVHGIRTPIGGGHKWRHVVGVERGGRVVDPLRPATQPVTASGPGRTGAPREADVRNGGVAIGKRTQLVQRRVGLGPCLVGPRRRPVRHRQVDVQAEAQ